MPNYRLVVILSRTSWIRCPGFQYSYRNIFLPLDWRGCSISYLPRKTYLDLRVRTQRTVYFPRRSLGQNRLQRTNPSNQGLSNAPLSRRISQFETFTFGPNGASANKRIISHLLIYAPPKETSFHSGESSTSFESREYLPL
jgi:hypothetical protein